MHRNRWRRVSSPKHLVGRPTSDAAPAIERGDRGVPPARAELSTSTSSPTLTKRITVRADQPSEQESPRRAVIVTGGEPLGQLAPPIPALISAKIHQHSPGYRRPSTRLESTAESEVATATSPTPLFLLPFETPARLLYERCFSRSVASPSIHPPRRLGDRLGSCLRSGAQPC